jgi:hypothetical protein
MRFQLPAVMLVFVATLAYAQAPDDALHRGQLKAGTAYSEVQKAEFATRQAEQEYHRADASHKAAQKRVAELSAQAEAAQKKFDAAKSREAAARKTYDAAVDAVDKITNSTGKKN